MPNVAYIGGTTQAPFQKMYGESDVRTLSDTFFTVQKPRGDVQLVERPEARATQILTLPSRERFEALVTQWQKDILFDSFSSSMKDHESFAKIVAQGFGVVPLIAAHLRRKPSFLFLVLEEIFGEDPVREENFGNLASVTNAWLEWLQR